MQVVQPAQVIPYQHPAEVLVKETDGENVDVRKPRIDGDTLRGEVAQLGEPYAVALKDIVTVKAQEPDKTKTWIMAVGGVALGSVALYALTQSTASHVNAPCLGNLAVESECQVPAYTNGP
jgi:hypothetical protein